MGQTETVGVLTCASCGSAVALREGDTTRCLHCDAVVPIPAAHQRLRALERADTRALEEASALARRIVPARRALRLLAWVVDSGAYALVMFLLLPGLLISPLLALFWAAEATRTALGFDLFDLGQLTGALFVAFFTPAFAIGIVPILAVYGRRRATARLALLRSLAARPTPGTATLTCRSCGAPLELGSSELVERCVYCHTDNLRLPSSAELERRSAATRALGQTIAEATRADAEERRALARRARRNIALVLTPVILITSLGVVGDVLNAMERSPTSLPAWYSDAFKAPRPLHFCFCSGVKDYATCLVDGRDARGPQRDRYEALELPARFTLPPGSAGVRVQHAVALRRGERLTVRLVPPASPERWGALAVASSPAAKTFEVRFGGNDPLAVKLGESVELIAPWHGWFRLDVVAPAWSLAEVEVELRDRHGAGHPDSTQ